MELETLPRVRLDYQKKLDINKILTHTQCQDGCSTNLILARHFTRNVGCNFRSLIMNRVFDIIFFFIALMIFAVPTIIISLLLIIRERHSILFRQERIGKDKQPYQILKFQTLINEVPTKTGKILRKTGLDELPQFLNVLKGDMSIVGPRALTKFDIERLAWNDDYHSMRWNIKPGITGFAQIYGGQHRKTSWFWDKHYIKNNNVIIDFGIVGISFLMNILGKTRVRQIIFQKSSLK